MRNLDLIEFGNEFNFYMNSDLIVGGIWNVVWDCVSQVEWQRVLVSNLIIFSIIFVGVFFGIDKFNNVNLVREEGNVMVVVKNFNLYNYLQWVGIYNLVRFMSYSVIVIQIVFFKVEVVVVRVVGKDYIMGEINSVI